MIPAMISTIMTTIKAIMMPPILLSFDTAVPFLISSSKAISERLIFKRLSLKMRCHQSMIKCLAMSETVVQNKKHHC